MVLTRAQKSGKEPFVKIPKTPQKGQQQPNASVLINHPKLVNFLLSEELPEETSIRSIRSNLPEEDLMMYLERNGM